MSKQHLGHTARKRFGQNFLHDEYVINQIVDAINPQSGDNLVEIGPGLAALTEPMCERIDKLKVVELDKDLVHRLQHHPFINHQLTIFQADALDFDFSQLADQERGELRVFGNLPYNISTPLMFHLFSFTGLIKDMHFMLQKEVVKRLAAGPGSKAYGKLSVMAQYYCRVVPVLEVPPGAFKPPPKVDSAVVRLVPHKQPPVEVKSIHNLQKVVSAAFGMRRKTIRNSLSSLLTPCQIEAAGLTVDLRAENLTLQQFATLSDLIDGNQS